MKKVLSLLLAVLTVFALTAVCLPAAAANTDPAYPASQSLTAGTPQAEDKVGTKCFFAIAGGLDNLSNLISKDYTSGAFYAGIGKKDSLTVDIKGLQAENGFGAIITLKLAAGTKSSFVISVPTSGNVPNSFTVYTCDSGKYWGETVDYNKAVTEASSNQFTEVAAVTGLNSDNKWKTSADGSFRYYEADFATSFTAEYIAIGFPKDISTLTPNSKSQYKVNAYEFAVFADKLPGAAATTAAATTAAPVTTATPETTAEVTTAAATTAEVTTAAATTAEATTAAVTTEAPATSQEDVGTTAAPDATTAAPATEAPASTTEAPKTEEKKGCGSVAAIGVALAVCALGTAVLRKKEN